MIRLRPAGPDDALLVADLHVRSWRSAYRGILPDGYLDGPLAAEKQGHWRRVFDRPPPGAVVLIAEAGGEPKGFVAAYPEPPDGALVDNLHVLPEDHGKGIGRLLMTAAAVALGEAGVRRARLWVFRDNRRAVDFYRKLGGVVVGEGVHRLGGVEAPDLEIAWEDLGSLAADATACRVPPLRHLGDEPPAGDGPAGSMSGRHP